MDIGIVIAFGMAIGTLFTLFVTPVMYTFLARDHASEREKAAAKAGAQAVVAPAPAE
jgi:multidrug efflux pump